MIHSCHNSHLLVRRSSHALYETNCCRSCTKERKPSCSSWTEADWGRTHARNLRPLLPQLEEVCTGRLQTRQAYPRWESQSWRYCMNQPRSINLDFCWVDTKTSSLFKWELWRRCATRLQSTIATTYWRNPCLVCLLAWVWGSGGQDRWEGGNPSAQHGRKPDTSCEPNLMCTVIFMCNFIRHTHSLPVCVLVCVCSWTWHTQSSQNPHSTINVGTFWA